MADRDVPPRMAKQPGRGRGVLAAIVTSLMLGACAQMSGEESGGLFASLAPPETSQQTASAAPAGDPRRATEYWGEQYSKNPRDLDASLAYAQNLTAMGQKREALAVLQQASIIHGQDRRLARDYGRLALDLDQVSLAKKLLAVADDPANPDWRVILARGTVLAKEGSYRDAIAFYERARELQPNHPSVLNNLALAYTMSGDAERGETLLRQAQADGGDARVRQNLALVLGLQGKYEEATQIASSDLQPADAKANTAMLQKMVRREARSTAPSAPAEASWAPAVAQSSVKPPVASAPAAQPASISPAAAAATAAASTLRPTKIETGFGGQAGSSGAAALFMAE